VQHHSPNDVDQLRAAVEALAHELAEALTAANTYLEASRQLESRSDPARLNEAISKAIEQTQRAAEVVAKLRSIARPQPGRSAPPPT
jgi:C4-dicarboxylate-specific signal transduction histidine kinase